MYIAKRHQKVLPENFRVTRALRQRDVCNSHFLLQVFSCIQYDVTLAEFLSGYSKLMKTMYRISANSFRRNYSFLNLALCTVIKGHAETIQGQKLFAVIRQVIMACTVFAHVPLVLPVRITVKSLTVKWATIGKLDFSQKDNIK